MFTWIFFAAIFLIAAACVTVGILKAKKFVWQFSLAKLITVIVSLVLSVVLAAVLAKVIAKAALPTVLNLIPECTLTKLLDELPSATAVMTAIATIVLAPALFIILFNILKPLLGLLKKPITRLFLKLAKQESNKEDGKKEFLSQNKFDGASAICGAICSLVLFIAAAAPIVGYLNVINGATSMLGSTLPSTVVEITDAAAQNPGSKAVKVLGGDLIFNSLTTTKVNGNKVVFSNELDYLSSLGNALYCASDESVSRSDAAAAIKKTAPAFEKTTLIPTVASEFLSGASDDWSRGRDFCDIAAPEVGKDFEVAMNSLYKGLGSSTVDTIREDYYTISNVLALIVEHNALDELEGDGDMLHLFKDEELISGIMLEMLNNERLAPSIEGFANAGISIIARSLGVYDDPQALYHDFISEMRSEYRSVASSNMSNHEKFDKLSVSVDGIYTKYGISISDGVAECIALSMLDDGTLSDEHSFELFFGADDTAASPVLANGAYAVSMLASGNHKASAILLAEKAVLLANSANSAETLATSIGDVLNSDSKFFKSLPETDRLEIEALIAAKLFDEKTSENGIKYTDASFVDAKEFSNASVRITIDQLYISMDNVTDNAAESKALAGVLSSAVDITDKVSDTHDNMVDVIKSFGPVLDSFLGCESIGIEGTSHLVTAIMQSDKVTSNIGFTVLQSNEVASVINKHATDDHDSYTSLLNSVGQTVDVIKKSADKEDTTESVKELIETITPSSAETLKQLTTPETVKNYGVPDENAEKVSDVLGDMFGQMSDAKENGMTEEKYQDEANAVNDMLNIAMNIGESKEGESIFGEESVTGITATEYVDRVLKSEVISNTVVNAAYDSQNDVIVNNPLGMARELTSEEKNELVSAIDTNWKSSEQTADDKNLLGSIAAILGVELEFNGNNITLK